MVCLWGEALTYPDVGHFPHDPDVERRGEGGGRGRRGVRRGSEKGSEKGEWER